MVRDVCSKYIYDKCPAVAAVGEWGFFSPQTLDITPHLCIWFENLCPLLLEFVILFILFSPLQVQLSSFLTTTECAVLCTGFGSKCSFNFIRFPVISSSFIFCSPLCKQPFFPHTFHVLLFSLLLWISIPSVPLCACSRGIDTQRAFKHTRLYECKLEWNWYWFSDNFSCRK